MTEVQMHEAHVFMEHYFQVNDLSISRLSAVSFTASSRTCVNMSIAIKLGFGRRRGLQVLAEVELPEGFAYSSSAFLAMCWVHAHGL